MDYRWQKSSYSNGTGGSNCVEVRNDGAQVQVRHSQFPTERWLDFTYEEWLAFIAGVKAGEFNL